jgi:hypothetical protein
MGTPTRVAAIFLTTAVSALCGPRSARGDDRAVPAATPSPVPSETRSATATPEHHRGRTARTIGWISLAVGAEAAVVAIVTSIMMLHDKSVRDANCDASKVCNVTGLNANNGLANLADWNVGAWAIAAAGLGVGGLLILTSPADTSRGTALLLGPEGTGVGVGVRSSF